jgi:flagellar protein FlgJ
MGSVQSVGNGVSPLPEQIRGSEQQLQDLHEVAREFESLFVGMLLRAMRDTVIESDLFNPQGETKYYRQLHDEELARVTAAQDGGLGVADLIVNQLAARLAARDAYGTELASDPGDN